MNVTVNGKQADIPQGSTLEACLTALGYDLAAVVAERNESIVPKDKWAETLLAEGDSLEVVSFVGGG